MSCRCEDFWPSHFLQERKKAPAEQRRGGSRRQLRHARSRPRGKHSDGHGRQQLADGRVAIDAERLADPDLHRPQMQAIERMNTYPAQDRPYVDRTQRVREPCGPLDDAREESYLEAIAAHSEMEIARERA